MIFLGTPYQFKLFKGWFPQILLSPFLNNLSYLLKKDTKFVWHINCEKGFIHAKKELKNPKSLTRPDFWRKKIVYRRMRQSLWIFLMQEYNDELKPIT